MNQDRHHIYPTYGRNKSTHWTGKKGFCWCDPEEAQVCPQSDEDGRCLPECAVCEGTGLVVPYDESLPLLIVHKPGQLGDHLPKLQEDLGEEEEDHGGV